MKREDFDHAIRAAASILGVDEVIVIGSQAIHGVVRTGLLPAEAMRSVEVDIVPFDDADEWKADTALLREGLVDPTVLHERVLEVAELAAVDHDRVLSWITR